MQPMNLMEREAEMAYRNSRITEQFSRSRARERRGEKSRRNLLHWRHHPADVG
jgi:hypothetical protein